MNESVGPVNDNNKEEKIKQQKQTNTVSFSNNFAIQRDSLKLERDSTNLNIYYLSFNYQTYGNVILEMYLNSKLNEQNSQFETIFPEKKINIYQTHLKKADNSVNSVNTNNSSNVGNQIYSNIKGISNLYTDNDKYFPFLENTIFIDIGEFHNKRIFDLSLVDLTLRLNLNNNSYLYMFFKIALPINNNNINSNSNKAPSLKYLSQKLYYNNTWYNMHDVYGLACKNEEE